MKATPYRTRIKIISDVLHTADGSMQYDGWTPITHLIRNANVSHSRLVKILGILVSQGLLEQVDAKRAKMYRISMSGKRFLKEYREFSKFSENFGLSI